MRRHHARTIVAVAGAVAFLPLTASVVSAQSLPAERVHAASTGSVPTTVVTGDRDHRDKPSSSGSGTRDHREKPTSSRHHPPAGSDPKPVHVGPGGVHAGSDPKPVHVGPGGVPAAEGVDNQDTKDDETTSGDDSTGGGSSSGGGSTNDNSSTGGGGGSDGAADTGDPTLPNDRGSLDDEGRTARQGYPSFQRHLPEIAMAAGAVAALGFGSSAWLAHRKRRVRGPWT